MGKSAVPLLNDAKMAARYFFGLRSYLKDPIKPEQALQILSTDERTREQLFLRILQRHVFSDKSTPYTELFRHAGIELGDVRTMLDATGLEGTLTNLLEAGVYLRMDEFKGRRPIERPNLSLTAESSQFDNPWADPVRAAYTGGSTGRSQRVLIGFEHMTREACHQALLRSAFDLENRPSAMWRPVPPGVAGMNNALRNAKLGVRLDRWFSQTPTRVSPAGIREYLFSRFTVKACRIWGPGMPYPEHVPLTEALTVASWLAGCAANGTPGVLNAPVSSAVRVCSAAANAGLDISGSVLRVGGEALTAGRAQLIRAAGCVTAPHYAMAEIGMLGLPCAAPLGEDDVHFLSDKLAVIQRPHRWSVGEREVGALVVTTLQNSTPKVMINVDTGDYGIIDHEDCGCSMAGAGYRCRISGIRSYEKLTSEGMNFLEGDVVRLIDEILPQHFGGDPTDYQLVQNDRSGVSKVSVVVSPRLGEISDREVVDVVLRELASGQAYKKMMSRFWEEGETMEVLRREPFATLAAKVNPLHFIR